MAKPGWGHGQGKLGPGPEPDWGHGQGELGPGLDWSHGQQELALLRVLHPILQEWPWAHAGPCSPAMAGGAYL